LATLIGVRRLPISVQPIPGETLNSWLLRAADSIKMPPARILEGAGFVLGQGAPSYPGFGVDLTAEDKRSLAFVTNVDVEALSGTLLRVFDGRTVSLAGYNPASPSSLGTALRSQWLLAAPTPACPMCLVEDGYVWRLDWKTVWVFACERHNVLLLATCPSCRRPTGNVRHDKSLMPPFLNSTPSIDRCTNPLEGSGRIGGGRGTPCGSIIEQWRATSLAAFPEMAAANAQIVSVLHGDSEPKFGTEQVSTIEWFTALRSLTALIIASVPGEDDLGPLPDECLDEMARSEDRLLVAIADRDGRRARGLDARSGRRSGTTWRTRPALALIAACAPTALSILNSTATDDALAVLVPAFERVKEGAGRETRVNTFVSSHQGIPMALSRLYKLASNATARASHQVGIGMASERPALNRLEPRHVPQLLWPDRFEDAFAPLITGSYEQHGRRWTSLALVQHIAGIPRRDAVEALGYVGNPDATSKNLSAVWERVVAAGHAEAFGSALRALALDLDSSDAPLVDYAERRDRFEDFDLIDEEDFEEVCDEAGKGSGLGGRRRNASAWLWAHLTGNDPRDSPALAESGETEAIREVYRRWVKADLGAFREPLESYAEALIATDGFRLPTDRVRPPVSGAKALPLRTVALAEERPDLAADWHPTLNGSLTPMEVGPGSNRKVWWKCATCGREWEAVIQSRARNPRPGCEECRPPLPRRRRVSQR